MAPLLGSRGISSATMNYITEAVEILTLDDDDLESLDVSVLIP